MTASNEDVAKPKKMSAQEKVAATDRAARAIIDAETTKRERKTERLRALRLEQEARTPPEPKPAKSRASAKKATRKKSTGK